MGNAFLCPFFGMKLIRKYIDGSAGYNVRGTLYKDCEDRQIWYVIANLASQTRLQTKCWVMEGKFYTPKPWDFNYHPDNAKEFEPEPEVKQAIQNAIAVWQKVPSAR